MNGNIATGLLAILGSVIVFLLGLILTTLSNLEKKLDSKIDLASCLRARTDCKEWRVDKWEESDKEFKDLWDGLSAHSHTGLPSDSKVTR